MQSFYFTKADLYGIPRGRVELFQEHAAVRLLRDQAIEPFDARKHGKAPGAKEACDFMVSCGMEFPKGAQPITDK